MGHALLRELQNDPRGVFVSGIPWTEGGRWVAPAKLGSPVLCTTHNSSLSGLDSFMHKLFKELRRYFQLHQTGQKGSFSSSFSGPNLERWLLKALCGMVASKHAFDPHGNRMEPAVPITWIQHLFSPDDLPSPLGLYVNGDAGTKWDVRPTSFGLAPLGPEQKISGLAFSAFAFKCSVAVEPFSSAIGAINPSSTRRPGFLRWHSTASKQTLDFCWAAGSSPGIDLLYGKETSPSE